MDQRVSDDKLICKEMDLRAPLPPEHIGNECEDINPPHHVKYETTTRHLLCRMFISSQMMELGSEARFTGLALFHRYVRHFYRLMGQQKQRKSRDEEDTAEEIKQIRQQMGRVAAACLFLGCKMTEEPRRIRDVINLSNVLNFCEWDDSVDNDKASPNEPIQIQESANPPPLDDKYWTAKEDIVSTEQSVLRMLQFDALVCHPHRCVLVVMDTLGFGTGLHKSADDSVESGTKTNTFLTPEQSDRVILDAWKILNEASLDAKGEALVYPVIVLACAAISLAADGIQPHQDLAVENSEATPKNESNNPQFNLPGFWWRALDVKTAEVEKAKSSLQKILNS